MEIKSSNIKYVSGVTSYVINWADDVINVNTLSNPVTIYLPSIRNGGTTKRFYINDYNSNATTNNITIQAASDEQINASSTYVINNSGTNAEILITSSSDWLINSDQSVPGTGTIKGSGTAGQIAIFSAMDTIASYASLLYDNALSIMQIGAGSPILATTTKLNIVNTGGASGITIAATDERASNIQGLGFYESLTEFFTITKNNSSVAGNISGTSIPNAGSATLMAGSNGNLAIALIGSPIYAIPGIAATNIGFKQDTIGLRIDQLVNLNTTNTSVFSVIQSEVSGGANKFMYFENAEQAAQTASTEINGVNFNLTSVRQWNTGTITTQREFLIQAPTYAAVASSTMTHGATFAITGAPIPCTDANLTITNAYALWVQSGITRLDGNIDMSNGGASEYNFIFGTNAGTKIGTSASQLIGFWGQSPVIQQTDSDGAATFLANISSNVLYEESTFDGYTLGQIVRAMRTIGILA